MAGSSASNAKAYARLKSSRGRFPVRDVILENSASGFAQVRFDIDDDGSAEHAPFDLESLACGKRQATQTTGYQIQYSTSSSFKSGNKTATVKSSYTTSKTVKKLKAKKKYYVRMRTYKIVNGTKYYSAWSVKKSVKTK